MTPHDWEAAVAVALVIAAGLLVYALAVPAFLT